MTLVVPTTSDHNVTRSVLESQGWSIRAQGTGTGSAASTAWPANNQAYLIPFLVSTPITLIEMFTITGNAPGAVGFDLGIYNDSFIRLGSIGATTSSTNSAATVPANGGTLSPAVTLTRGRYFFGISCASTTWTVQATTAASGWTRAIGMFTMATAHPLPATFVPASMGTTTMVPMVFASTVTYVL